MNNLQNHFKEAAREIKLTSTEKKSMRQVLHARMFPRAVPSPYFNPLFMRAGVAFVLVLLIGGGSTFAAEGSLPGDTLYPVKTSVIEPAQGLLALSPEAKVSWNTKLVTKRIEEAETLVAKGSLSENTAHDIVARIEKNVQEVEDEDASAEDDTQSATELASSLSAHGQILAQLSDDSSDDSTRRSGRTISAFLSKWNHRGNEVAIADQAASSSEGANTAVSTTFAAKIAAPTPKAAKTAPKKEDENEGHTSAFLRLKNASVDALARAQDRFNSIQGTLDASSSADVTNRLSLVKTEIENASTTTQITKALRDATTLTTFLSASGRLNRHDILTPILDGNWKRSTGDSSDGNEDDHSGSGNRGED